MRVIRHNFVYKLYDCTWFDLVNADEWSIKDKFDMLYYAYINWGRIIDEEWYEIGEEYEEAMDIIRNR